MELSVDIDRGTLEGLVQQREVVLRQSEAQVLAVTIDGWTIGDGFGRHLVILSECAFSEWVIETRGVFPQDCWMP